MYMPVEKQYALKLLRAIYTVTVFLYIAHQYASFPAGVHHTGQRIDYAAPYHLVIRVAEYQIRSP